MRERTFSQRLDNAKLHKQATFIGLPKTLTEHKPPPTPKFQTSDPGFESGFSD